MNTCGLTRLLVPATLVGLGVTTVTGSDPAGWAAAVITGGAIYGVQALRGTNRSCAIPPQSASGVRSHVEAGRTE